MHRETAHTLRRSRSLVVAFLALTIVAVLGMTAQQALAIPSYAHDDAAECATCHTGSPSSAANATNAKCITCHTGYAAMSATKKCWTCHDPGQDMTPVKTGAPATCTATCHMPKAATNTHVAHTDRPTTCTVCHLLTASATNANNSPHHTAKVPVKTTISLKITPTSIKIKKSVKATGAVTPADELVGVRVFLKAELKKGTKWAKAKTGTATVSALGRYTWTYKPGKKGSYRVTASITATDDWAASKSTKPFKVK